MVWDVLNGVMKIVGSDTMNAEMVLWAEDFQKQHPNVTAEVEGKGSSAAATALVEGTAHFGSMSRPFKSTETSRFVTKFHYPPVQATVSWDEVVIYVHHDNPLQGLTWQQADGIFSKTRNRGAPKSIEYWGDLGLTGPWAKRPIQIYGRNSASGTYGFFKDQVLAKGDFKDTVKEQVGSSAIVDAIAHDRNGIGYSGVGYKTHGVNILGLTMVSGHPFVFPLTGFNVFNATYPLKRPLLIYANKDPHKPWDPVRKAFLSYVLSPAGQEVAKKDGYAPLESSFLDQQRKQLGVDE